MVAPPRAGYSEPMMLTCCASSISDLLKPKGSTPPKLGLSELPRYIRDELGLHGLNLSTDLLAGATRELLTSFRDQADKDGCACLMLMCPDILELGAPSARKADAAADRITRVIEAAHLLGCNSAGIRIKAKDDEDTFDLVADRMRPLMERAERLELNVLINPSEGLTGEPDQLTSLIKRIGGFRVGTLPDFRAAVDSGDPEAYMRRIAPYASVALATTYEFADTEAEDDTPGSIDDLAAMLMSAEAAKHTTFDFEPLLSALGAIGFDGTIGIDYRGGEDGTLGVLRSKDALEAAMEALSD